jgi:hypothetical protein
LVILLIRLSPPAKGEVYELANATPLGSYAVAGEKATDALILVSTRFTWTACQIPRPVAVGMLRSLNATAMPTSDVRPAACSSRTIGAKSQLPVR